MTRIEWARAAQFNWAFDNMGGTPLQDAVAGNWQGATAPVEDVNYRYSSTFGQPIAPSSYQTPRTASFSFGVRF